MAKAVIIWDDRDLADGQHTEADKTHTLTLDGKSIELDLSADNLEALRKDLEPWWQVGRRVTTTKAPAGEQEHRAYPGRKSRDYYWGLQSYAAEKQIKIPAPGGKNAYPAGLRRDWDRHLAAHPDDLDRYAAAWESKLAGQNNG